MPKRLLFPDDARKWSRRRYEHQHRGWIAGGGVWPLAIALGDPGERHAAEDSGLIRSWVDAWRTWDGSGRLQWEERRWPRLGPQRLPAQLVFESGREVAQAVGEAAGWDRASERYAVFAEHWEGLRGAAALIRHLDLLADYSAEDFQRLLSLLQWLEGHRDSGHYLRQLPIAGMDTKWIDAKRRALVVDLVQAVRGDDQARDFHALCGLQRPPHRIRMRLLCSRLRAQLGGLGDIEAPQRDLAALRLEPERVVVVENLETGIALPEIPGCVAFMKLGMGVSVLGGLPWLRDRPVLYWGDIDTHGFAILDRARAALPGARSLLMDETTLLANRSLWGQEADPHGAAELTRLTAPERALFEQLRANTWGQAIRLEQERIPWSEAITALHAALASLGVDATRVGVVALAPDEVGGERVEPGL